MKSRVQGQDIKLFRIFYELARAGGFSQTQISLNVSQSSLSTSISQLETRLGMRLCTRGHAGFKLTEDGNMLLAEIRTLFEAMESFSTKISDSKSGIAGELALGVLENSVTHPDQRIIRSLVKLQEIAPKLRISIYTAGALELEVQVLDRRLHGAIGLFPHRIDSLMYQPLFYEDHYLFCANGHPLFDKAEDALLTIDDIAKFDYVSRDYVDKIEGLEPPEEFTCAATARHMEGIIFLLLTNRYFGYLPDHTAQPWVEKGKMRRINVPGTMRKARFMLTLRKDKQRSRALKELLAILSAD